MRLLFIAIIVLHGLVHIIGFFRAFGLLEGKHYSMPVSKLMGLLWLATAILFEIVAILVFNHNKHWWLLGSITVVISQVLIIFYWHDAKFGTIINFLILYAIIIDFGSWSISKKFHEEVIGSLERTLPIHTGIVNTAATSVLKEYSFTTCSCREIMLRKECGDSHGQPL